MMKNAAEMSGVEWVAYFCGCFLVGLLTNAALTSMMDASFLPKTLMGLPVLVLWVILWFKKIVPWLHS